VHIDPLSAKKSKVTLCQHTPRLPASPSLKTSILLTCGFAFGHSAGMCFHVVYTPHLALKGLTKK